MMNFSYFHWLHIFVSVYAVHSMPLKDKPMETATSYISQLLDTTINNGVDSQNNCSTPECILQANEGI